MKALKTIFKILYKAVETCAILFIIIFVSFVLIQRFSNNKISIGGLRMFSVVSESMAPTYVVGDIIITKQVEPKDLKVGDDVSYLGKDGSFNGKVVTHRIILVGEGEGEITFQTKGINNPTPDPIIKGSQIYGKVIYKTMLLSRINKAIQTSEGFYVCIFVPLALVIGSEVLTSLIEKYKEKHGIED